VPGKNETLHVRNRKVAAPKAASRVEEKLKVLGGNTEKVDMFEWRENAARSRLLAQLSALSHCPPVCPVLMALRLADIADFWP
jgi:hypothetical protein